MGNDVGSAFAVGWFQGALLTVLALILCGLIGREWRENKERALDADLPAFTWAAHPRPPREPARVRPRKPVRRADANVREARAFSACSGAACYHDVRPVTRGCAPMAGTVDVNAGLP